METAIVQISFHIYTIWSAQYLFIANVVYLKFSYLKFQASC